MDNSEKQPIEIEGMQFTEAQLFTLYEFLSHPGALIYQRLCWKIRQENTDSTIGNVAVESPSAFYRAQGFERAFAHQTQIAEIVQMIVSELRTKNG